MWVLETEPVSSREASVFNIESSLQPPAGAIKAIIAIKAIAINSIF